MKDKAQKAKKAAVQLASVSTEERNAALLAIAKALGKNSVREANKKDVELAEKNNVSQVLRKRLAFNDEKIGELAKGLKELASLEDPIGKELKTVELDEGLILHCVSCPIGVIGIIFESRPDALVQISSLCLKSGNAVLLKGGKEAANTNKALVELIEEATKNLPSGWIQLLETRADVNEMLKLNEYIDLVIPRGSNEFVKHVMDNTKIPVLGHSDGICHLYIESDADIEIAVNVSKDSKCQYPAVCNAVETLLVHEKIAKEFLPKLKTALNDVELKGDKTTQSIIEVKPATDKDWDTEYNDLILSIKIVKDIDEAINHINTHGSKHTDAIITSDEKKAEKFMKNVDAANVLWNCSTRFSDGYRYGFGAEVGISTSKIHARGPVGLDGLAIYKWKVVGKGQIVADYTGSNPKKKFTHKEL